MWLRHANPWSFWSRWLALPLLALAVWSRIWAGWQAAGGVALIVLWLAINPFIFPPVKTVKRWESRAILGEHIWLKDKSGAIPKHHLRIVRLNLALSTFCIIPFTVGLIKLDLLLTLSATLSIFLVGLWFADRMAWIFDDMVKHYPDYQALIATEAT